MNYSALEKLIDLENRHLEKHSTPPTELVINSRDFVLLCREKEISRSSSYIHGMKITVVKDAGTFYVYDKHTSYATE